MGGDKIMDIGTLQIAGYGYRNLLEQSERFEGPYIPSQVNFNLVLNFTDTVGLLVLEEKIFTFDSKTKYLIDDGKIAMRTRNKTIACPQDRLLLDDLYLNPLLLFQKALGSPTLRSLPDTVIQHIVHHRVSFLWRGFPVTISLNSNSDLPTMVEVDKPYTDNFLGVWGDVNKVVLYSFWDLFDNGVHYPRQKDVFFNHTLWESTVVTDLKINQPVLSDSLRIPAEVKKEIANYSQQERSRMVKQMESKKEIAPGIWFIPGFCNSTVVQQDGKLTIIESPNTSLNMELIFDQAQQLFPKAEVVQVITTSDAWLHVGGIRTSASRTSIVALKGNKEVIESLLAANYRTSPDAWQKKTDKRASIRYIGQRTAIGSGTNRMELIPFRSEAGERMMMVYFPELKLLYASDLLQPGNWEKHYSLEVVGAVNREKLAVERIYAMHMEPMLYSALLKQLEEYLPK